MRDPLSRQKPGWLFGLSAIATVFSALCFLSTGITAQTPSGNTERASYVKKENTSKVAAQTLYLKEYRKITIGVPADTLREVWGKPKMEYPDGFIYEMSDSETVQIVISPEKIIIAISVTFAEGKGAPAFVDVFGESITPEERENGSVYKMVRYPDAGYWVAYSVGPGENANVSLTLRKL